jgi:hypothetical protein
LHAVVQFTNWVTDENLRWPVQPNAVDKNGKKIGPMINYTLDWYKIVEPPSCEFSTHHSVPFSFKSIPVIWMNNILDAHKNIEAKTCIRFQNSSEGDHLHYYWGYGCHSLVGRNGGKQWISLGPGCWTVKKHLLDLNQKPSLIDTYLFSSPGERCP